MAANPSTPQPAVTLASTIQQVNQDFLRHFQNRDAAKIAALYTEDAVLLPPNAPPVNGRAGIQAFWQSVLDAGFRDINLQTTDLTDSGDFVIETGDATLTVPDGKRDHGKYIVVWQRGRDGRYRLHRDMWSSNKPA